MGRPRKKIPVRHLGRVTMPVLPLIEHVGGIKQYCIYLQQWSQIVLNAHQGKYTPYFNHKYRSVGIEYYILRMTPHKTKRPYNKKARN